MSPPPPAPLCLALDIGGTKIEAALVTSEGELLRRERVDTQIEGSLIDEVAALLERVGSRHSVAALGVGCGGPMRGHGAFVSPLNISVWRDFPLLDALRSCVAAPVFIENDAKALALAEGRFGAAAGVSNYLSMVVSTGVGGGLVIDGELLDGREGNAGHVGHVVVCPDGRACVCGSRGCLEAEASGSAIAAMTGAPAAHASDDERRRCGRLVGQAVSTVAALLDFDRCFVAGSVALGFGDVFFRAANDSVAQWARIEHARTLRIEPSALRADGPLLGAACVAWRGLSS